MNKKQLAEMIKELRNKKLKETIGKPGPLNPAHHKATHGEDPESPNQYAHKLEEMRRRPKYSRKSSLGKIEKRYSIGAQSQKGRNLNSLEEKEEINLGKTDTGQNSETIDRNPNIPTAKGETTKNTTVKETKEK